MFELLGMSREDYEQGLWFLLGNLGIRIPPHGGLALRLDQFSYDLGWRAKYPSGHRISQKWYGFDPMLEESSLVDYRQVKNCIWN